MTDISIHDNFVTGYAVSCEQRTIVLHTHTDHRSQLPIEHVDVIFRDVEAYHIFRDNMATILFDVSECDIDQILIDFSAEFEAGVKYVWPGPWNESPAACRKHLQEGECRAWTIFGSYGMTGFVIAKDMELKRVRRDNCPAT